MALTYATAAKTARMTATRDRFQNGTLEIGTAGMGTVLATFTLSATGGTVVGDTWALTFVSGTVAASTGGPVLTAAAARIKRSASNGGAAEITGLSVGVSGADINLDNASIANGQNVTLTSASIQHAA
jgi:urease accessory protein UreH